MRLTGEIKQIGKKTGHIQTEKEKVKFKSPAYFNGLEKGDTVRFEGEFHGDTFHVTEYELQSRDDIASLLSQIDGINPSVAEEIKSSLKASAKKLFKHPECIYEVENLSDNMKDHIYSELKHLMQRAGFVKLSGYLQKYGIDTSMIYKAFAHFDFSLNTMEQIRHNPYRLVFLDTDKAWFKKLDEMASDQGYDVNSDMRKFAKIISILLNEEKRGHCYIKWGALSGRLAGELKNLPRGYTPNDAYQDISKMLDCSRQESDLPQDFRICAAKNEEDGKEYRAVYRQKVFYSELDSARYISANERATAPPSGLGAWIRNRQANNAKPETKEQIDAINMFWHNNISILTGGPGTGKTHAIGAVLSSIRDLAPDLTKVLTAPTGRAARRMEELLGHKAQTIHSLVGNPNQSHLKKIDADIVIVDETSMLDIVILKTLLTSLTDGARIMFVGDPDQLPSVQPGNVLRDMLHAGVPSVRLTSKNFRSIGSIVKNAHQVISGSTNLVYDNKFKFAVAETTSQILDIIKQEAKSPDTQVLTSRKEKNELSAEKLNLLLRPVINPGPASSEKNFRRNDKIICVRNNWAKDKNVCNGEIGTVMDVVLDKKGNIQKVTTRFAGNDRPVVWSWIEANVYLEFAYAITVHKSQGSEYGTVIIPISEDDDFMDINLFYTAITRAKNKVVLVGKEEYIGQILAKKPQPRRTFFPLAINACRKSRTIACPKIGGVFAQKDNLRKSAILHMPQS